MTLSFYLKFDGHCAEAFRFYADKLGAEIQVMSSWGDGPMADQVDPADAQRIMHASLRLGGAEIMGTDSTSADTATAISGANVVYGADTAEEADRIFALLAEGGQIQVPIAESFWAQRFGIVQDRFGVPWMVNCDKPQE